MKDCWKKNIYTCGKIYKLVCNKTGLCYYGSTTQSLNERLAKHKDKYKNNRDNMASFKVFENDDYKIELIENYPCFEKIELRRREQYWISNNECVNKKKSYKTEEEINEYKKQMHQKALNTKILCRCGIETSLTHKARHEQSKFHLSFIK